MRAILFPIQALLALILLFACGGGGGGSNANGSGPGGGGVPGTAPVITAIAPSSGVAGSQVTLTGTHLDTITNVQFLGCPGSATFTTAGATSITATVPPQAATGNIQAFGASGSAVSPAAFVVTPAISRTNPTSGPVGSTFAITGTGLVGTTSVTINGHAAPFTISLAYLSAGEGLAVQVPAGATTGPVVVTTRDGLSPASPPTFTVTAAPQPTITGFTPTSAAAGQSVTLSGTGLFGVQSVALNGTTAQMATANPAGTSLLAVVPAGAATGTIAVTTAAGTATSAASLTITAPPANGITSITPAAGAVGAWVTIACSGYGSVSAVDFNGVPAPGFSTEYLEVNVQVPAGASSGPVHVTAAGGTATSPSNFTVLAAGAPALTKVSPTAAAPGTSVTLTGSNLAGATAVAFNGIAGTIQSATAGAVTATVPAASAGATGPVTVTTPAGTATSPSQFTVLGATPKTWYVDAANTGSADGSSSKPWSTIANGIKNAASGDTILVRPNTYREYVNIAQNGLTLQSTGGEAVISGFNLTTGWAPQAGGVYTTSVTTAPDVLFVDMTEAPLAHLPAQGWFQVPATVSTSGGTTTLVDVAHLAGQPNLTGATIQIFLAGGVNATATAQISGYDTVTGTITFPGTTGVVAGQGYLITNAPGLIQAGQWAFTGNGPYTVSFKPNAPGDLGSTQTRIGPGHYLVAVSGSNNTIKGFVAAGGYIGNFRLTGDNNTVDGNVVVFSGSFGFGVYGNDTTIIRNAILDNNLGIDIHNCNGTLLQLNEIAFSHGDAIDVRGMVQGITIRQNYIHHTYQNLVHPDGLQVWGLLGGAQGSVQDLVFDQNLDMMNGQCFYTEADTIGITCTNNVLGPAGADTILPNSTEGAPVLYQNDTFVQGGYGIFNAWGPGIYMVKDNVMLGAYDLTQWAQNTFISDYNLVYVASPIGAPVILGAYDPTQSLLLNFSNLSFPMLTALNGNDAHSAQAPSAQVPVVSMPRFTTRLDTGTNWYSNTTGTLYVLGASSISVGDIIEVNCDGIARTVNAVTSNSISVTPALPTVPFCYPGGVIEDWGPNPALPLRRDVSLLPGSSYLTMSSTHGPLGSPISISSWQAGAFGTGARVLPTIPANVQAGLPSPNSWNLYLHQ